MTWRQTRDYRLWRVVVIKRDKICQICTSKKKRHAHHLNHASFFVEQRFDVNNGICLCAKCHTIYHNKFHDSTRKKCTKARFLEFKTLVKYIKGLK